MYISKRRLFVRVARPVNYGWESLALRARNLPAASPKRSNVFQFGKEGFWASMTSVPTHLSMSSHSNHKLHQYIMRKER